MTEPMRCHTCELFSSTSFKRICRLTGEPPEASFFYNNCSAPVDALKRMIERMELELFRRNLWNAKPTPKPSP